MEIETLTENINLVGYLSKQSNHPSNKLKVINSIGLYLNCINNSFYNSGEVLVL